MGANTSTAKPLRIMTVGDSMTQGQEGDWTWRYRFWQWLTAQDVAFELVGPWKGTQAHVFPGEETPPGPRATGGYAKDVDRRFNGYHFSAWGRAVAQVRDIIKDEVAEHKPDILLVMLGFNDIGWFISDAKGTLESMTIFVQSARAGNPDVKLALANIPHRRFMDGREDLVQKTNEYNKLLAAAIPQWTTDRSPVRLVNMNQIYQCTPEGCPAGYDGLHPNALGDYQIARAFSETCVRDFNISKTELTVPSPSQIPPRPISVPANVQAFPRKERVKMTWDRIYGAYGYDVQHRTRSLDGKTVTPDEEQGWHFNAHNDERHDVLFLTPGDFVELRVRTTCGEDCCSEWSDIVSATAL